MDMEYEDEDEDEVEDENQNQNQNQNEIPHRSLDCQVMQVLGRDSDHQPVLFSDLEKKVEKGLALISLRL